MLQKLDHSQLPGNAIRPLFLIWLLTREIETIPYEDGLDAIVVTYGGGEGTCPNPGPIYGSLNIKARWFSQTIRAT